ncbi:hypothetical protein Tco_0596583 [Tanacetum coccineum]
MEIEPKIYIAGLHCNRVVLEGVKFLKNKVENTTLLGYKMMAYDDKSASNQKFVALMDKMISERPDKHTFIFKKAMLDMMCSTSTTPIVEKNENIKRLIIDGKVTLVDDEGKPLAKVYSSGDHDSEDEVASVDNKMASFLASKKVGYGIGLLDRSRHGKVMIFAYGDLGVRYGKELEQFCVLICLTNEDDGGGGFGGGKPTSMMKRRYD